MTQVLLCIGASVICIAAFVLVMWATNAFLSDSSDSHDFDGQNWPL